MSKKEIANELIAYLLFQYIIFKIFIKLTFFIEVLQYIMFSIGGYMKEIVKKYLTEFKTGTKTMFKEFFNKETNKKQRANMWTFSRLVISLPILIFSIITMINFSMPVLITNSVLVALGAITDVLDGKSARKHNSSSEYGKKLDQIVDKVFSAVIGTTLSIINPIYLIPLIGEAIIASINVPTFIKYKNINDSSSMIGRIKQWPLGVAFFLGYLSPLTLGLSAAATTTVIITACFQGATAITYLNRNIKGIKKQKISEIDSRLIVTLENTDNKELEKVFEKEETNTNVSNCNKSKQELINELKEFKQELISDNAVNNIKENSYQKKKNN